MPSVTPLPKPAGRSASRPGRLALSKSLVVDAEARCRHGFETGVVNMGAARLARSVGALVETAQRVLDIAQLGFDPLEDGEVFLALECFGAEIGLVLIDAGQLREVFTLGLVVEMLVGERIAHALEADSFVVQPLAGLVGVHLPTLPMSSERLLRAEK